MKKILPLIVLAVMAVSLGSCCGNKSGSCAKSGDSPICSADSSKCSKCSDAATCHSDSATCNKSGSCAKSPSGDSKSCQDGSACPKHNTQTMTRQSENFIFAADTPWYDAGDGVVRQILGYNDNIMMVKVKFKKGQEGAIHSHPHSQVTYVASGKFKFTVGGITKIVQAGDALYKQPDLKHGCVCLEDGILIDCFNPMRDTFLDGKQVLAPTD